MRADNFIYFIAGGAITYLFTQIIPPKFSLRGMPPSNQKIITHMKYNAYVRKPTNKFVHINGKLYLQHTNAIGEKSLYNPNTKHHFTDTIIRNRF